MSTNDTQPPSKGKVLLTGKAGIVMCNAFNMSLTSTFAEVGLVSLLRMFWIVCWTMGKQEIMDGCEGNNHIQN